QPTRPALTAGGSGLLDLRWRRELRAWAASVSIRLEEPAYSTCANGWRKRPARPALTAGGSGLLDLR
ncbi:MAG TPA: hypothetical protein PK170_10545, partial [Anaerolineae bacterium]|nr:hypothetical protein [Anaerolineae bacterium]